ncbi:hypothetical protein O5O45_09690 [Hahella aquimaris]|uniref:hypothetical protein n=1 Tax=Hahella sp. HNIBRBA332 TaxID=3015983 RepID=UPI00273C15C3|nr:hypothetical protein [Hahella sp. HNIBRBA332]WLQ16186.1 hypothetical protein O5O45_09690 [Hahella sp. HNIBRBA332]
MASGLGVLVTSGDSQIGDIFSALEGALDRTTWRSSTLLNERNGDGKLPLVLLGHANELRFKTSANERKTGADVVNHLVTTRKLTPSKFGFVFLAGCRGAHTNREGLYIDVGNAIGLPVLASTTSVSMGRSGSKVSFTPIEKGEWKVYYPDEGVVYNLRLERCKHFRDVLASVEIQVNDAASF